jgi:hypothetical protein
LTNFERKECEITKNLGGCCSLFWRLPLSSQEYNQHGSLQILSLNVVKSMSPEKKIEKMIIIKSFFLPQLDLKPKISIKKL